MPCTASAEALKHPEGGGKKAGCVIKCLNKNSSADKAQGAFNSLGTMSHACTHAHTHTHTQSHIHTALKGPTPLPPPNLGNQAEGGSLGVSSLAPQNQWISARRGQATLILSTSEYVAC